MTLRTVPDWKIFAGLLSLTVLVSCQKSEEISVLRLDQQLFANPSANNVRAILNRNPAIAQLYFKRE